MFNHLSPSNEEAGFFFLEFLIFQFLRILDSSFLANFTASLMMTMSVLSHSDCLSYYSEKKKTKQNTALVSSLIGLWATPFSKHTL